MGKVGRPAKEINKELFEKLCGLHCTLEEIAGCLSCSDYTLEKWCKQEYGKRFSAVYKEKRTIGNISLRRIQWDLAKKSTAMAIFLGKNYLGQSDRQEVKLDSPIPIESNYDLSALSEEELLKLREILMKAKKNGKTTNPNGDRSAVRENPPTENPES